MLTGYTCHIERIASKYSCQPFKLNFLFTMVAHMCKFVGTSVAEMMA